jgi:hypothetical protein
VAGANRNAVECRRKPNRCPKSGMVTAAMALHDPVPAPASSPAWSGRVNVGQPGDHRKRQGERRAAGEHPPQRRHARLPAEPRLPQNRRQPACAISPRSRA